MESACSRCQLRQLECGPKLPPQQRPRSITFVPSDFRRPVSLHLDTRLFANVSDEYDTPLSAGSAVSAPRSQPASPFIVPSRNFLGRHSASVTPLGGSPAGFHLDAFEPPTGQTPLGYYLL